MIKIYAGKLFSQLNKKTNSITNSTQTNMEIQFTAADHKYTTRNDPTKKWLSATGIIGQFKPKFDKQKQAIKFRAMQIKKGLGQ